MSDRTLTDELTTARLRLRPWRTSDLDAYYDMYSRWDVMRYLGSDPKVLESRDEAAARLTRRAEPDPDGPPYGVWAVCDSDEDRPVGTALLKLLPWSASVQPVPERRDVEIGWHLHPDVWGRGYATEAAHALLARAAEHGIDDVRAVTYPDNAPSQAVCRRIGLEYAARTDRYYDIELDLFCRPSCQDT